MNRVHSDFSNHAYMWSRNGPAASSGDGDAIAYQQIPGLKNGQTIWLNNACLPERPDWQYKVYENGREICCNRHFRSADEALDAADVWLAGPMQLSLRGFECDGRFEGFTVDGLLSADEAFIVEVQPGEWLLQETHLGLVSWKGRFSTSKEALAAYKALVN